MKSFKLVLFFLSLQACSTDPGLLKLTTADQRPFFLNEIQKSKAAVFVFLSPECPLCQNYMPVLNRLNQKYQDSGITMYGVFPGTLYSGQEIKQFAERYNAGFTMLTDKESRLVRHLKATITPEVFVLDAQYQVLYSGRIDNWAFAPGNHRQVITEHELEDALSSIQQNKAILKARTQAVGCLIETAD